MPEQLTVKQIDELLTTILTGESKAPTGPLSQEEIEDTLGISEKAADTQYNNGIKYAKGGGVPQDYAKAAEWFSKAAAQGHAEAQYELGGLYLKGDGVPQDNAKAAEWFRKAAAQGHKRALNQIEWIESWNEPLKNVTEKVMNLLLY